MIDFGWLWFFGFAKCRLLGLSLLVIYIKLVLTQMNVKCSNQMPQIV